MTSEQTPAQRAPRLAVQPLGTRPEPEPGSWRVTWRIENQGEQPLQLVSARLPHDHFLSSEHQLAHLPSLQPGQATRLELIAAVPDPPGAVVENAFLVLRLLADGRTWRLLARHRVVLDSSGIPHPECEAVTLQQVGFSS